jgi:trk system potassium uptake protein TrkH
VVFDTWTQFSGFGQAVILVLIQIGGLGFMTVAILFSMVLGKRIGLKERSYLMEAVSSMQLGGVVRLVKRVLLGTLLFEASGAVLLSIRFCPVFGLGKGIWYGVFHAGSAFCNAGFDLMGSLEPYTSLTPFAGDVLVNLTVIGLIIVGGIGFVIWDDIMRNKWHIRRYQLHSKLALSFSGALIIVAFVFYLVLERNHAFAGMNPGERILAALFHAVTPRTAGFNTTDTAALSEGGSLLTIALMLIGAAPGSTGGGIKITTFAVILLSVAAKAVRRDEVDVFNRRLNRDLVKNALNNTALYLSIAFCGCFLILAFQNFALKDALFEVFSAIGTVGLSTGITRDLAPASWLVIILLMYAGRIGSLAVFMAIAGFRNKKTLKYPEEKVIIG